jgi:hypothetical protein
MGAIDVKGERFDLGDEYVQVTRAMGSSATTNFLVERREDLREIKLSCQKTGTYSHWLMTEARGGTFLDVEFGMQKRLQDRLFDATMGGRFFRRWIERSIESLRLAAAPASPRPSPGGSN